MTNDIIDKALKERFLLQKEYLGENKIVNKAAPLVSVTVATYQHVGYIKQCLEGILMQKTNFPYEIIIGEDGSTDGTQEICKEYAEKYPDRIRLYIRDRKLSQFVTDNGEVTRFNGIWNRMSARGKYIAWCEGDDYWIDPLKLQKQVDFLEKHPEYGLCYTNYETLYESKKQIVPAPSAKRNSGNIFEELLQRNFIVTATVLFRTNVYYSASKQIMEYAQSWSIGDYPLWLEIAKDWKIKYLRDCTTIYRVLSDSASHSSNVNKTVAFNESVLSIQRFFAMQTRKEHLFPKIEENFYAEMYMVCLENRYGEISFYRKKMENCEGSTRRNRILRLAARYHLMEVVLKLLLDLSFVRKLYSYFTA